MIVLGDVKYSNTIYYFASYTWLYKSFDRQMLLLKKALRLRLQAFPLAPNVHQIASDLVNEDFTCVVIAPVLLIKLIIKVRCIIYDSYNIYILTTCSKLY